MTEQMAALTEYLTVTNGLYVLGALIGITFAGFFLYETFRFKGPRARIKGRIPLTKPIVREAVNEILVPVLKKEVHISGEKLRHFKPDGPSYRMRFMSIYQRQLAAQSSRNNTWSVPLYGESGNREIGQLTQECLIIFTESLTSQQLRIALERAIKEWQLDDQLKEMAEEYSDGLPPDAYKPVDVTQFGQRQGSVISTMTRHILAPYVEHSVNANILREECLRPLNGDGFHIHLGAWPANTPTCQPRAGTVGGAKLHERGDKVGSASGLGDLIFDDMGNVIGELVENNLYFYENVVRNGSLTEARYFAEVLARARSLIKQKRTGKKAAASAFVEECLQVAAQELPADCCVDEDQQSLVELLKKAERQEQDMFHIESNTDVEAGKEFDALLALDKVIDVKVTGNSIVVTTKTLHCQHPSTLDYHEIGAFDIHIYPQNGSIQWKNQTRMINGGNGAMNAPHVNGEGNACFGNTQELFPALINKRDFATAVMMAIAFVESVNIEDSWGKYIVNWPVVPNPYANRARR